MRRRVIIVALLLLSGCGIGAAGGLALLGAGASAISSGAMYYFEHQPSPTATVTPILEPAAAPTK